MVSPKLAKSLFCPVSLEIHLLVTVQTFIYQSSVIIMFREQVQIHISLHHNLSRQILTYNSVRPILITAGMREQSHLDRGSADAD